MGADRSWSMPGPSILKLWVLPPSLITMKFVGPAGRVSGMSILYSFRWTSMVETALSGFGSSARMAEVRPAARRSGRRRETSRREEGLIMELLSGLRNAAPGAGGERRGP